MYSFMKTGTKQHRDIEQRFSQTESMFEAAKLRANKNPKVI